MRRAGPCCPSGDRGPCDLSAGSGPCARPGGCGSCGCLDHHVEVFGPRAEVLVAVLVIGVVVVVVVLYEAQPLKSL